MVYDYLYSRHLNALTTKGCVFKIEKIASICDISFHFLKIEKYFLHFPEMKENYHKNETLAIFSILNP